MKIEAKNDLRGFTILELLVATSILALLLVLVTQLASHTMQTSRMATNQIESTQEARRSLDALSGDLAQAVLTDGATLLVKSDTAPVLAFLVNGRGTSAQAARYVAVSYQVINHQLVRSYQTVDWKDTQRLSTAANAENGNIVTSSTSANSVLASGILQLSVLAVLESGTTVPVTQTPNGVWGIASGDTYESQTVPENWTALVTSRLPIPSPLTADNSRVRSLLVAIATVDASAFKLLSDTQKSAFPQATTSNPVAEWETNLLSEIQKANFPVPARSSIRFVSKVIDLP